jgi:hypothetical protein
MEVTKWLKPSISQRDQVSREADLMFGSLPNARISVEAPDLPTLAMIPKRCRRHKREPLVASRLKSSSIISRCLPSPRVSA